MEKHHRSRSALLTTFVVLTVLSLLPFAQRAYAAELEVRGCDQVVSEGQEGSIDVLTVTGDKGETVYLNVKKGDETIASHLAFTLGDGENTQVDANGEMVGVVTVEFIGTNFSYDDTYAIEVYADRTEKDLLYKGTISTVLAQLGDGAVEPLVVRTLASDEERPYDPPQTIERNGITYELENKETADLNGRKAYTYREAADTADSTTAHINYYDVDNLDRGPIKTEEITLARNTSQTVSIEDVIASDDGGLYRTLQLSDAVTVSYPGATEQSIMCKALNEAWGNVGSFYTAKIRYVDAEGNGLSVKKRDNDGGILEDTVLVNKPYTYTAPTNIYVDDNGAVRAYTAKDDTVLRLAPGDAEEEATYEIVYEPISDEAERTWTVVVENGSVSPSDPGRIIKRETFKGKPGETARYDASKGGDRHEVTVDDQTYIPAAASEKTFEHTFGPAEMEVEQSVYYVPADYVLPEAYEVSVNYVNIANNEIITTETYTASPSMRSDLEITTPESFAKDGVEWIRLNGQESPLRHGFYSPIRSYVVYYRDVNDDLHANTVIRTVRVEYIDPETGNTVTRPTTVVDNGTTTTEEFETAGGTTEEGGAATGTGLQTGADLLAIDGDDGDALVGQDGTDTATRRIEDEETPLAQLNSNKGSSKLPVEAIAAGGVAAAAAIGLVLFFVFRRRRRKAEEPTDSDATV